jgi:beta-glucosidase/6-phospho-beta-glucosidase/beta-galactosidase
MITNDGNSPRADGFKPRFGLIEVDYNTQERKIRESAKIFNEIK